MCEHRLYRRICKVGKASVHVRPSDGIIATEYRREGFFYVDLSKIATEVVSVKGG